MGIKKIGDGGFIATGAGIEVYHLAAVRSFLKLEAKGMRFRHGSIRKGWALNMGLKHNATYAEVIAAIEKRMATLKEAVEGENQAGV